MTRLDSRGVAVTVRRYPAVVHDVIDGDTVHCAMRLRRSLARPRSLGFHVRTDSRWLLLDDTVRLDGIDAPGKEQPDKWAASTAYLTRLLPAGTVVTLLCRQVGTGLAREKYGRWLGTVLLSDGRSVNDLMVEVSLAVRWDGHGPHPVQ